MRNICVLILTLVLAGLAIAQNEQSPISEKPIVYKDWTLKNVKGGGETNLRSFAKGKKLVMVVYWAPWCPNWRHDLEFVKGLHDKYAASGLAIIGVGEYDPVDKMKAHLDQFKLTFPMVYESDNQSARMSSNHYLLRTEAGDKRRWGTPWYVLLDPATLKPSGEVLTDKTTLVNGELVQPDAEKYIREKLGLEGTATALVDPRKPIEACEPDKKVAKLSKP
ncbi:MAG TPA: TlpA disulfide reductase family protein [Pyrinomonadaceae bacterium]|nr:TlpA disulfide reductase family protein [Pyrinomonadaceae bacterium]